MSYRQDLFPKTFARAEFKASRASCESINPDWRLAPAGISFRETDPLLRSFVHETPELISFVDEFLRQLGTFCTAPSPRRETALHAARGTAEEKQGRTRPAASAL